MACQKLSSARSVKIEAYIQALHDSEQLLSNSCPYVVSLHGARRRAHRHWGRSEPAPPAQTVAVLLRSRRMTMQNCSLIRKNRKRQTVFAKGRVLPFEKFGWACRNFILSLCRKPLDLSGLYGGDDGGSNPRPLP
jgi:hypothetical protein